MSSNVVKRLQKLHIEEQSVGLEDLAKEGFRVLDGCPITPVRQKQLQKHGLTESMVFRKEKAKVAENEKYYYRSPCPEKENLKNIIKSPSRADHFTDGKSLLDSVAKFAAGGAVTGTNCKVFVGNLSYKVRSRELREFFEQFGDVMHASVCKDRKTKKSRGFGFVVFSSREGAEKAVNAPGDMLSNNGRILKVTWAEQKKKGKVQHDADPSRAIALEVLAKSYLQKEVPSDSLDKEESEEDCSEEAFIDMLNEDILLRIFVMLELKERIRIERVCRKWYNISRESWRSLISLDFKGMFTPFKGIGGLTDKIFLSILNRGCNNLQYLDFSGSPFLLTPSGLRNISSMCTSLKSLDLSNVAVNNQNMKEIGLNCKEIETLVLGRCRDFGEKGLWWFLKEARNLKHLEVTDNVRVTGKSFWMLSDTCQVLNLYSCVKISDDGLECISKRVPNLRSLNVGNCLLVTDNGLTKICSNNTKLRKLVLSEAGTGVTAIGLMSISQLLELEYLNLAQNHTLDDSVLTHIVGHCKKLRYLNIEACHGSVTDTGVKSLSCLENLEELNISYLTKITNDSLQHLAANCGLKSLLCKACSQFDNSGLVSLLSLAGGSLVSIDLSGCYSLDDNILNDDQLTKRYDDLPRLKINVGGTSMTREGAEALAEKLANCEVSYEKRYSNRLRNDFDPTSIALFYPSDDEDDDECPAEDNYLHSTTEDHYPNQSCDLQDNSMQQHCSMSLEQAEDFLDADDPALLDELEDEFLFDSDM